MIDKIFYINLDRRPDRNTNVQNFLQQFNLQLIAQRISAVDGSKLNLDHVPKTIISEKGIHDAKDKSKKTGIPLTPGGIGCALSHRTVWEHIITQNLKSALILEDDIRVEQDFHNKLNKIMNSVKGLDYDVLFLGYHPASLKYLDTKLINNMFVRSPRTYGLFGYVVSKKGAEKLLKIFPIDVQIDTAISEAILKHRLNVLLVRPDLRIITSDPSEDAKQFGTDIQSRETFQSGASPGTIVGPSGKIYPTYNSTLDSPDAFFYHIVWFMTAIITLYLIGMFSGLMNDS